VRTASVIAQKAVILSVNVLTSPVVIQRVLLAVEQRVKSEVKRFFLL
jgi:hypothetical protein